MLYTFYYGKNDDFIIWTKLDEWNYKMDYGIMLIDWKWNVNIQFTENVNFLVTALMYWLCDMFLINKYRLRKNMYKVYKQLIDTI